MRLSRRDLAALLPALAAAQPQHLPSHIYRNGQIPYEGDAKKEGREFFHGTNHAGFGLEMHETILGRDVQTQAPHKHDHGEIIIVFESTLETYLEGKTQLAESGSVIYFGPNQMHSARNAGATPCRYYVLELRG